MAAGLNLGNLLSVSAVIASCRVILGRGMKSLSPGLLGNVSSRRLLFLCSPHSRLVSAAVGDERLQGDGLHRGERLPGSPGDLGD